MVMLVHRMIDEAALRHPDACAVRCDGEALSYEQLARHSNGLAGVLLEAGLQRRNRVAVLLSKGLKVPVGFYGVLAAGGVLVPIDPRSPVERVARILRATGAKYLVTEPGKQQLVVNVLERCPWVEHVVGLEAAETDRPRRCHPWSEVSEAATDRPPGVEVIDMDPSYILHTSGTTGTPKLILHTHRSAMSFVDWAVDEYSLNGDDRLSNHSSHHTCFATFDYYAAARAGATTVILTPAMLMMPGSLSALLEKERVSVWYSVPTALVQLSVRGDLEARDLSSLRWVLFAGETFPNKHLRRIKRQLPEARFSHVYGSTEVNVCTYYHLPEGESYENPVPIGKACWTSSTAVVDGELRSVPDGEVGELLVRGSTVMSGYWGEPQRSREVLIRRPVGGDLEEIYFRTGDRVRVRADGNLTFVTRADRQVKIRGHRVELEEIEMALLTLDPVEEAAAFTVPDGEGSWALQSVVVVADRGWPGRRDVLSRLKSVLPQHSLPEDITVVEAMPRTPTGKIDRNALRQQLAQKEGQQDD